MALRPRPAWLAALSTRTLHTSGQVVVRLCVLAVVVMVWLAAQFGLDILLGAFVAGLAARLFVHAGAPHEVEVVTGKLEGIGFGFLVPLFFVVSGMRFDLDALLADRAALVRLPVFLVLFLVARGLPVLVLYRSVLAPKARAALAVLASVQLPLVVVITGIGVSTGRMVPANAAALVGAGLVSVLVFPLVGLSLARRAD